MDSSNTVPARVRPIAPAPTANGHSNGQSPTEQSMPYTCIACARRKVKCDKLIPVCSACRKGKLECHYEAPPPRKRKRKPVEDVHERLDQYERLLKQHGIWSAVSSGSRTDENTSPTDKTPSSADTPNTQVVINPFFNRTNANTGKLLSRSGKSRYIDSNLWRDLSEEQFNISEDEDDQPSGPHDPSYQNSNTLDPLSMAFLGAGGSMYQSLLNDHPTYDAAMRMWSIYTDRVDPVTRILHIPTTTEMVQRAAADPSDMPKSTECLLFTVYHASISSLTDDECKQAFGETRAALVNKYHASVRQALINVGFLRTTEFLVVQSYVIFLISVRGTYDPHTFWMLTGLGVRMAQRIGLHRDGLTLGMKPFDVQMRRRLFWQLLPLDGFASQISGTGIYISDSFWDTHPPLNLNDTDIDRDTTEMPAEIKGATDMIFCMIRAEVGKFHKKMKPWTADAFRPYTPKDQASVQEFERALSELENDLEVNHLRYIDFAIPIHCLAQAMARTAMSVGRMRVRMPLAKAKAELSREERDELLALTMKILNYEVATMGNPMLKKYQWHLQNLFIWEPVIWILHQIRHHGLENQAAKAWEMIDQLYQCRPQLLNQKRSLHTALNTLALNAWDAQSEETRYRIGEPIFVQTLRARRAKTQTSQQQTPSLPSYTYNPFYPGEHDTLDPPMPDVTGPDMSNLGTLDFNLYGSNAASIDWLLWDNMIKEMNSAPPI